MWRSNACKLARIFLVLLYPKQCRLRINVWLPHSKSQLRQVTNTAARAEPCYISLALLGLSLQATYMNISSLHEDVVTWNILKCLKNWSSHDLSNQTQTSSGFQSESVYTVGCYYIHFSPNISYQLCLKIKLELAIKIDMTPNLTSKGVMGHSSQESCRACRYAVVHLPNWKKKLYLSIIVNFRSVWHFLCGTFTRVGTTGTNNLSFIVRCP